MRALGAPMKDVDGIDLSPAFARQPLPDRELYAESFAPLVEFGWAPLRAVRSGAWKAIAAPRPELFDVGTIPASRPMSSASQASVARSTAGEGRPLLADRAERRRLVDRRDAAERLRALGYSAGSNPQSAIGDRSRPDPKDRRELAARIAQVTSGELAGAALLSALEGIVRDDPRNGQAQLRLGYARLQAGDCAARGAGVSCRGGRRAADSRRLPWTRDLPWPARRSGRRPSARSPKHAGSSRTTPR